MREVTENTIQGIVNDIVREFDPAAVYLFGSRARNEATAQSDIDLLVVSRQSFGPTHSRWPELSRLWRVVAKHRLPVDVLLYSQEEVGQWRSAQSHVIGRALSEGRQLYDAG